MRLASWIVVLAACHHAGLGSTVMAPDARNLDAAVPDAPPQGTAPPVDGASIGSAAPVSITVSTTTMGAAIDGRFVGLSYEKGMLFRTFFNVANTDAVGLFERLGQSSIRIGGGSCDTIQWNHHGPGHTSGQVAASDVDALAAFLTATGWNAIYCVNLKTGTAALAADEVAYVTGVLGSHLTGIEIGNEPDNYGWTTAQYLAQWQSFASAIVAAVPGTVLTGPALGSFVHDAAWEPVVTGASPPVAMFTQHFYITCAGMPLATMGTMLSPAGIPFSGLESLDSTLSIPYRMAETNSFCGGGEPGASNTAGSALWAIDYLFAIAKHGGIGANFHTLSPNSSSVLLDDNGTITEVRPIYYGLLLFALAGTGSALETTQDAGGLNVTAYAIASPDGSTKLVVVNQTAATPIAFTVELGRAVTSASELVLAAPALTATDGVTLQGATVGLDGGFAPEPATPIAADGTQVSGTLAPASAALIDVP